MQHAMLHFFLYATYIIASDIKHYRDSFHISMLYRARGRCHLCSRRPHFASQHLVLTSCIAKSFSRSVCRSFRYSRYASRGSWSSKVAGQLRVISRTKESCTRETTFHDVSVYSQVSTICSVTVYILRGSSLTSYTFIDPSWSWLNVN